MPKKIVVMGKPFDVGEARRLRGELRDPEDGVMSQGARAALLSALLLAVVPRRLAPRDAAQGGRGRRRWIPSTRSSWAWTSPRPTGCPRSRSWGPPRGSSSRIPFYDAGSNDKGIGIQLAYSLGRVGLGFALAALVAMPLGFVIGLSPLVHRALNPFIQVLKPISPLAWMPLALYTIKDSATSSIFVIFICSVWPMLINTAHGVASVRRDWLNVARTLEAGTLRTCLRGDPARRPRP